MLADARKELSIRLMGTSAVVAQWYIAGDLNSTYERMWALNRFTSSRPVWNLRVRIRVRSFQPHALTVSAMV